MTDTCRRVAAGVVAPLGSLSAFVLPLWAALVIAVLWVLATFRYVRHLDAVPIPEPPPLIVGPPPVCEHAAECVPVEVQHIDEVEVIGWLCTECREDVPDRLALRRNARLLRAARTEGGGLTEDAMQATFDDLLLQMDEVIAEGNPDGSVVQFTKAQHAEFLSLQAEAEHLRDALVRVRQDRLDRARAGVTCNVEYHEVVQWNGNVVRRYAVPGKCLCGGCSTGVLAKD